MQLLCVTRDILIVGCYSCYASASVLRDGALKTFRLMPGQDVISRLTEKGFNATEIDALVLSHSHFDHIGDMDSLPRTTQVICGPGTLKAMRPGYPKNEHSEWWSKWFEEREFLELPSTDIKDKWNSATGSKLNSKNTDMKWQTLACYDNALDGFGDGSFWIVDTPGVSGSVNTL
jgi:glyoxylase-like metal-dependent hydrolase (beta-lactamase superfamily II)